MCHGHAYQYMGVFLQFCVEGRAIGFLQHISIDCLFYNKIHMWFISLHLRNFALAVLSGYVLPTQTSSTMVKRVNYWRIRVISCFLCLLKFVKCVLVLLKNFPLFITRISYLHSLFEYKIVLYCRIFLLKIDKTVEQIVTPMDSGMILCSFAFGPRIFYLINFFLNYCSIIIIIWCKLCVLINDFLNEI